MCIGHQSSVGSSNVNILLFWICYVTGIKVGDIIEDS
jgi:hypothetical protein